MSFTYHITKARDIQEIPSKWQASGKRRGASRGPARNPYWRMRKSIGKTKENEGFPGGAAMLPEGGPAHHFGGRFSGTVTQKSFKPLEKQTLLKISATQQIRVGAGSPLRCLSGAPATHWRGSTLDKVPQNPFKIIGKTYTSDDPRSATNECSPGVFQITAGLPGTSITF